MKGRDCDSVINGESPPEDRGTRREGVTGVGVSRGVAAPRAACEASTDAQTPGDGPSHTGHLPWQGVGDAKPVKQAYGHFH